MKVAGAAIDGALEIEAWGDGAEWAVEHVPTLLGSEDDPTALTPRHPALAKAVRRSRGFRLGRTSLVMDALLPAVLSQGTTFAEGSRAFREIVLNRGEPAPGPVPKGLRLQPDPLRLVSVPDWEWSLLGVDDRHARVITRLGILAPTLVAAFDGDDVTVQRDTVRQLLDVPGVASSVTTRVLAEATGDPDALDLSDPTLVRWLSRELVGRVLDADRLAAELRPYAGQRLRVLRLLEQHARTDRPVPWLPRPRSRG